MSEVAVNADSSVISWWFWILVKYKKVRIFIFPVLSSPVVLKWMCIADWIRIAWTPAHFRSRRWGKEWCIEKTLWLKSISNSLASIDIFSAMWRCGTILTYSPRRSTTSRNLTMKVSKASDIHTGSSWGRRQGGRRKCHSIIFGNIRQSLEKGSPWLEYVYIRFLDSLKGEDTGLAVIARCPNSPRVQE